MSVFENLCSKRVKRRKRWVVNMPMPQARSGGLKWWSCCPHARQLCSQWQHFFQASCVDLLIQFFTLLALLRACKKLVNDRGSQGVWSPSASGQGSLHSMLPLIRPLRFFYPILPIRCNFPVGKGLKTLWYAFLPNVILYQRISSENVKM